MKQFLILFSSILFLSSNLMAEELVCKTSLSTVVVSENTVAVEKGERVLFEEFDGYHLWVKNLGDHRYELEVFDESGPSRGYASAFLHDQRDELGWATWTRNILLETACRLAPSLQ